MTLEAIHIAVLIRFINLAMLSYLIVFYWKGYGKIRSSFTGGLLFFSVILFLQNLSAIFFRLFSGVDLSEEVYVQNIILNLLQALGLVSLVYITRK